MAQPEGEGGAALFAALHADVACLDELLGLCQGAWDDQTKVRCPDVGLCAPPRLARAITETALLPRCSLQATVISKKRMAGRALAQLPAGRQTCQVGADQRSERPPR